MCYDGLGCFSRTDPFNNTLGELPDSPHEINIRTYLWTKDNPNDAQELSYHNLSSISGSSFDPERPTKVLIHGYMSSKESSAVVANLSVAFLKKVIEQSYANRCIDAHANYPGPGPDQPAFPHSLINSCIFYIFSILTM